jgi:hypothetical protein
LTPSVESSYRKNAICQPEIHIRRRWGGLRLSLGALASISIVPPNRLSIRIANLLNDCPFTSGFGSTMVPILLDASSLQAHFLFSTPDRRTSVIALCFKLRRRAPRLALGAKLVSTPVGLRFGGVSVPVDHQHRDTPDVDLPYHAKKVSKGSVSKFLTEKKGFEPVRRKPRLARAGEPYVQRISLGTETPLRQRARS